MCGILAAVGEDQQPFLLGLVFGLMLTRQLLCHAFGENSEGCRGAERNRRQDWTAARTARTYQASVPGGREYCGHRKRVLVAAEPTHAGVEGALFDVLALQLLCTNPA